MSKGEWRLAHVLAAVLGGIAAIKFAVVIYFFERIGSVDTSAMYAIALGTVLACAVVSYMIVAAASWVVAGFRENAD